MKTGDLQKIDKSYLQWGLKWDCIVQLVLLMNFIHFIKINNTYFCVMQPTGILSIGKTKKELPGWKLSWMLHWNDFERSWKLFELMKKDHELHFRLNLQISLHICVEQLKHLLKKTLGQGSNLQFKEWTNITWPMLILWSWELNKFKISGATMTTWWFKQGYFFPLILVQQNFSEVWQFLSYTEVILLDIFCINSVQSNMSKNDSTFYKMAYYIDTQANFKQCVENLLLFQFSPFFSSSSFFGNFV